jgi:hypothetical protein
MNLTNLKTMSRFVMREAKKNDISDTELELVLNEGALEVAAITCCLKTSQAFDATIDVSTYNLSSKLTRFLVPDDPGLWYRSSVTDNYVQLDAVSLQWLDENKTGWRDLDSGTPTHYSIDGDTLTVVPAPVATVSSGFLFYFGQKPAPMTDGTHYPFGGVTEISRFTPLHKCIIAYWEWQATKALNKGADNYKAKETAFYRGAELEWSLIQRRRDIASNDMARFGRKRVSSAF